MPLAVTSAASVPSSAASLACSGVVEPDVLDVVVVAGAGAGVLVRRRLVDRRDDGALVARPRLAGVDQLGFEAHLETMPAF
jgi:hypothetical protein